jgi:glycosyltransferase involved in cell wall biosynthesis
MTTKSNQLICVPIEPLTERYSEQWYRLIPKAFSDAGYEVTVVDGHPLLEDTIQVGTFLDMNSTAAYKASQIELIAKMFYDKVIQPGATFFFYDIEFWGLEQVRLLSQMNNVPVFITGFLHAASYTTGDAFAVASSYQQYTELGWIASLDKVFVGSDYHKRILIERRLRPLNAMHLADKVHVTLNPVFVDEYPAFQVQKSRKVLLTNRLDAEKNPEQTLELFRKLKAEFPDWEFVVTTGRKTLRSNSEAVLEAVKSAEADGVVTVRYGLTKDEYHRELAEAAFVVSHSREESYGYCIAEAMVYKAVPLLANAASHPEFVSSSFLFDDQDDAEDKMYAYMRLFETSPLAMLNSVPPLVTTGMANIINEIKIL